jgi:glucokinase-like ROK family protein
MPTNGLVAESSGRRYPLVENRAQSEIVKLVRRKGRPVSRSGLTEALGFSRAKVAAEVNRLVEVGLLVDEGLSESEGGRPSSLFNVPRSAGLVAAVDVGVTSIAVALTTLGGDLLVRREVAADVKDGPRRVLGRVKRLLAELADEQGVGGKEVLAIGVGVPGPVQHATGLLVSPPVMPGWDRYPIRDEFAGEYAAPVFVDNDVNLMALGEHRRGVGVGVDNMVFVKVGTGIGGGIVVGGELYRGTQGCAGDLGHLRVEPDGPECWCGKRGCVAAVASAPAIVRRSEGYAREGLSPILGEILAERGELDVRSVGLAAEHGDHHALLVIRDAGRAIGRMLSAVVMVLNPSLIVVGGGVSNLGHALLGEIRGTVYQLSFPLATQNLPVVLSELGPDSGVVGAGALAGDEALAPDR